MSCRVSIIIATIGRDSLARAVKSCLAQPEFPPEQAEVIIVNDSGLTLPPADWQDNPYVSIVTTQRRERSVARNTGAAIAKGEYLHFLDDDDWLLPGAFQALDTLASQHPKAHWCYGTTSLVDRQAQPIIELRQGLTGNIFASTMAGEWIPLQSSWIKSDAFFAVGGFNPFLAGPEDIDLARRIAFQGEFAWTDSLISAVGMGMEGSSTNYSRSIDQSRVGREAILDQSGVFERLRNSANRAEWMGRIARIYWSSSFLNLQRRRLFTALSRGAFGSLAFFLSGTGLFTRSFWHNLLYRYESPSFLAGFLAAGRPVEHRKLV